MEDVCRVSIVIPTFNRAKTIGYCIHSILKQTYPPHEIIIVDDCSTDETVRKVEEIASNIITIYQLERNSGAQAARNFGIKMASGEWIAFHDSDDEWMPHKLEIQINYLRKVNFDNFTVIHTNCYRFYPQLNKKEIWELPVVEGENVFPVLLEKSSPMFQGMLTSKVALNKINLLDEDVPSYQEWDTAIRLAKHCRFVHIRAPLFIYYLHEGETISKNIKRDIKGYQFVIEKHRDDIIRECGYNLFREQLIYNLTKAMNAGLWDVALQLINYKDLKGRNSEISLLYLLIYLKIKPNSLKNCLKKLVSR